MATPIFRRTLLKRTMIMRFNYMRNDKCLIFDATISTVFSPRPCLQCSRRYHSLNHIPTMVLSSEEKKFNDFDKLESTGFQFVPEPSWSIKVLKLSADDGNHEKIDITDDELNTLARRCLINVQSFPLGRREKIKIDLASIMRCTSLVCNFDFNKNVVFPGSSSYDLSPEKMYDFPRFGKGHPDYTAGLQNENNDEWSQERTESKHIMQSIEKQKKLVGKEGEKYFSIVTTES